MSITEEMGRPFTIEEIKERVTPVLKKYGVERAVMFGSYAKGCATPTSDVDMIVTSKQRGLDFIGLLMAVEDTLGGVSLDFFDFRELIPGGRAQREISETGVCIYGD